MPDSLEFPSRFAIETPDHPAIINASDGRVVTYAQLDDRSLRIANLMRSLGLGVTTLRTPVRYLPVREASTAAISSMVPWAMTRPP